MTIPRIEVGPDAYEQIRIKYGRDVSALQRVQVQGSINVWELTGLPIWIIYAMHPRAWQITDRTGHVTSRGRITVTLADMVADVMEVTRWGI